MSNIKYNTGRDEKGNAIMMDIGELAKTLYKGGKEPAHHLSYKVPRDTTAIISTTGNSWKLERDEKTKKKENNISDQFLLLSFFISFCIFLFFSVSSYFLTILFANPEQRQNPVSPLQICQPLHSKFQFTGRFPSVSFFSSPLPFTRFSSCPGPRSIQSHIYKEKKGTRWWRQKQFFSLKKGESCDRILKRKQPTFHHLLLLLGVLGESGEVSPLGIKGNWVGGGGGVEVVEHSTEQFTSITDPTKRKTIS